MGISLAVCFDGSEESVHALDYALATGHRQITIVSVTKASKKAEKEEKRTSEMGAKAASSVAASLEKLGLPNEVPEILVLKSRDARTQLVEHIEGGDYDLCVVGNRGIGAIKRAFLGSTSQSLLNGLQKKPVCVVRSGDGVCRKGPRKYLLASDGSGPSIRAAELLNRLLQPEDTVHILGLYETVTALAAGAYVDVASALLVVKELTRGKKEAAHTAVQEACSAFPSASDRITTAVKECSHVGQALLDYAACEGIGTIVMGCRGRGAVSRAFLGSAANHVLHESKLPLIVSH